MNTEILLGIAASNVADTINPGLEIPTEFNHLAKVLNQGEMGIELQIEPDQESTQLSVVIEVEPAIRESLQFLGVHAPIRGIKPHLPENRITSEDLYRQTTAMAVNLEADYLLFHLMTEPEWDRLEDRPKKIDIWKQFLREQITHANEQKFRGTIAFENTEYPLYPASLEEIKECTQFIGELRSKYPSLRFGFCLDLAHLQHTGLLLEENQWRRHALGQNEHDQFATKTSSFDEYLTETLMSLGTDLQIIHLTNTLIHETHRMPKLEPEILNPRTSINLEQCLSTIITTTTHMGNQELIFVNEAHDYTYQEMIAANTKIRAFLSKIKLK